MNEFNDPVFWLVVGASVGCLLGMAVENLACKRKRYYEEMDRREAEFKKTYIMRDMK